MYIIVSDVLESSYVQFKVVKSFKETYEDKSIKDVEVLIYHRSAETELNAGVWFSRIKERYPEALILYISKTPSDAILMAVRGANGYYYEDEFYLHEEEELLSLIEEHKAGGVESENELAVVHSSLDIVGDFMTAFVNSDPRVNLAGYQKQVTEAVNNLVVYTKEQEQQIQVMGSSALSIFSQAAQAIAALRQSTDTLKGKVAEFEMNRGGASASATAGFSNSAMSFPTYRFMGNAKVLCFREWAPTRYLTSFALAYKKHLYLNLHKRVKLVFVYTRSTGISRKYKDMTTITAEVASRDNLFEADIIATNNPKRDVMEKLLKQPNTDIVLVVDRLYNKESIISGRVKTVDVVSSRSDFERYGVDAANTITSVMDYPGCMFCIPTLDKFPLDADTRYAVYFSQFAKEFAQLNKILGIGG